MVTMMTTMAVAVPTAAAVLGGRNGRGNCRCQADNGRRGEGKKGSAGEHEVSPEGAQPRCGPSAHWSGGFVTRFMNAQKMRTCSFIPHSFHGSGLAPLSSREDRSPISPPSPGCI
jgi:hypothetical protein